MLQHEDVMKNELRQPNLILYGELDDIVPLSDIIEFCKVQTNTQLEIIPGAGHRFKNAGEIEKIIQSTKIFNFQGEVLHETENRAKYETL